MRSTNRQRRLLGLSRRLAVCTAVSLAIGSLTAPAAVAQAPPTTPIPPPRDPNQPPATEPPPVPQSRIVGDAGAMLGAVRILPKSVNTDTILDDPDFEEELPNQSVAEFGLGHATAQANSDAFFAHESAIAEASPVGAALFGRSPTPPGAVSQTAVPDHEEPMVTGLETPESARAGVDLAGLSGSAQARWDEERGPCLNPIAEARTSLGQASAVNALPAPDEREDRELRDLGGLLDGTPKAADGSGSLVHVPESAHVHTDVKLTDNPGEPGAAVTSTSRTDLTGLQLFTGTSRELSIDVLRRPELSVTATGNPDTSNVDYQAPVLRISQDGEVIGELDAANPSMDVPVDLAGSDAETPAVGEDSGPPSAIDLGLLRLSIGEAREALVGEDLGAAAKLLDLQVLPDLPGDRAALAQVTFGEQIVRAGAPEGGVRCDQQIPQESPTAQPAAAPASGDDAHAPAPQSPSSQSPSPQLAQTSGTYHTVPLFCLGAGMLLAGSILVAALPYRRG